MPSLGYAATLTKVTTDPAWGIHGPSVGSRDALAWVCGDPHQGNDRPRVGYLWPPGGVTSCPRVGVRRPSLGQPLGRRSAFAASAERPAPLPRLAAGAVPSPAQR